MPQDRSSGPATFWLAAAILLTAGVAVILAPLAECPECGPFFRVFLDASGRPVPGRPINAMPAVCPLCGGASKVSLLTKWIHRDEHWYR